METKKKLPVGMENVVRYGIAFYKKMCKVVMD
jgi:hypothetical protein